MKPLPRQKAVRLFERAKALVQDAAYADAAALLEEAAPRLNEPEAERLLARCQLTLGKNSDAVATLQRAQRRFPRDVPVALALGVSLVQLGEHRKAAAALRLAEPAFRQNAELLAVYANTLLEVGQSAEALTQARRAVALAPDEKTQVLLCVALAANDALDETVKTAKTLTGADALSATGLELGARCAIALGDVESAVALWSRLQSRGAVPPSALPSFALALELSGQSARADALPKDEMTLARILLHRRELERCLEVVEQAEGDATERALIKARALRLSGRLPQAAEVLERVDLDEALPAVRSVVLTERGHLLAEQRQFDVAQAAYLEALQADGKNDEAQQGLALTKRQLSWRGALEQQAFAQSEAARLENESLKRLLAARQRELDAARNEMAALERARAEAEAARPAQPQTVRVDERLPLSARPLFAEAEATYLRSKAEPLSSAAVAFLYVTALERLLHELFVVEFSSQLDEGARAAFLRGAVREVRNGKPQYFDRFVQVFEGPSQRTPGLGEFARVLTRRRHAYLAPFAQYVERRFSFDADAVALAIERVKATRDAIAHGRAQQIDLEGLRRDLNGLLPALLGSRP